MASWTESSLLLISRMSLQALQRIIPPVITSYSIHYTKLYEAVSVANAMDIPIEESDIHKALAFLSSLSPDGKTSMHQDVDAKRKTEVNMLAGVLIELGKEYNVETPINKIFYLQIKAIEKMYVK